MAAFVLIELTTVISQACTLCPPYGLSALLGQNSYHKGDISAHALVNERFCGIASELLSGKIGMYTGQCFLFL